MRVNGRPAALGESADPQRDRIELDGQRISFETRAYWLLHKPRGVVATRSDPEGRGTVLDLLPPEARRLRLFPVGRLDFASEGLLLLTNDGALAQRLLHPSYGSEKEYVVTVRGAVSDAALARLEAGLRLDEWGRRTAPAEASRLGRDATRDEERLRIVLREGRRRQIRRSLARLGHPVRRLVRVRVGPLVLGRLARGRARELTARERGTLLRYAAALLRDLQNPPQAGARARDSRAPRQASKRLPKSSESD